MSTFAKGSAMYFSIYTQQEISENNKLTSFLLDTIIENLSYIYGSEMGSTENRNSWIEYNLKRMDDSWHAVIGYKNDIPVGFLLYTIENRTLSVNDIEIIQSERMSPPLLIGLLRRMMAEEESNFDSISGYINKANIVSQRNFLKYATEIVPRPNGFVFTINKAETDRIKARLLKN